MSLYETIVLLIGTGFIGSTITFIWRISKRDAKLDITSLEVKDNKSRIETIEVKLKERMVYSEEKVNYMEKDFIEIKTTQKNLVHSIDVQNKQVLDLIERLEKHHESFINAQKSTNEKLEASIDAIKNTLIHQSSINTHSNCIFHKKSVRDIKDIMGV